MGYKKLVTDEFEKMEGTRHDDICHMLVLFKSDNKNTLYLISKNYHVGYGYIIDFKDTSKYVNFKEDANMFILKLIQLINMNVIYLKT